MASDLLYGPTMTNTKRTPTLSDDTFTRLAELTERTAELAAQAAELRARIALEQNVRLARGTKRDVKAPTPGKGVPVVTPPVNDVASSPLYLQMKEMLAKRPYTLQELIETTKAEANKVKVVIMRMQRDEIGLENMGNRFRALWYIPSEAFRSKMKSAR